MPLTGQAKTDYQREYMRVYMRRRRLEAKNSDSVILGQKAGLKNARGLPVRAELVKTLVKTPVKTLQPELDADGNIVPEYA